MGQNSDSNVNAKLYQIAAALTAIVLIARLLLGAHYASQYLQSDRTRIEDRPIPMAQVTFTIVEPFFHYAEPTGTLSHPTLKTQIRLIKRTINRKDGAEMVWVPPGEFLMGCNQGAPREKPQRTVNLDGYWIYEKPVTVKQFRDFCDATNYHHNWDMNRPDDGWQDDHPVEHVTWNEAKAYCDWAGAQLPTEAQWEKAARGTDGRIYPWGNDWDETRLRCSGYYHTGTEPAGSFPSGKSPYGALDMAGNLWQWCRDVYHEDYFKSASLRNPLGAGSVGDRVVRGGAWTYTTPDEFRVSSRCYVAPDRVGNAYSPLGFRCVIESAAVATKLSKSKTDKDL
jgi:formylglycine-generating enzyme required for sulfatase activity